MEEGDAIISDELNHASIIDGIRLSKAQRYIYRHSDMNHLEEQLKAAQDTRTRMIITDGVFSMDGDICKLPEIVALAERYGAATFVDDAHSSGVLGAERARQRQPLRPRRAGGHPGRHALEGHGRARRLCRRACKSCATS